jgi:hypothetical protein
MCSVSKEMDSALERGNYWRNQWQLKDEECRRLQKQIEGHCERIVKQSDALSAKAERKEVLPANEGVVDSLIDIAACALRALVLFREAGNASQKG